MDLRAKGVGGRKTNHRRGACGRSIVNRDDRRPIAALHKIGRRSITSWRAGTESGSRLDQVHLDILIRLQQAVLKRVDVQKDLALASGNLHRSPEGAGAGEGIHLPVRPRKLCIIQAGVGKIRNIQPHDVFDAQRLVQTRVWASRVSAVDPKLSWIEISFVSVRVHGLDPDYGLIVQDNQDRVDVGLRPPGPRVPPVVRGHRQSHAAAGHGPCGGNKHEAC